MYRYRCHLGTKAWLVSQLRVLSPAPDTLAPPGETVIHLNAEPSTQSPPGTVCGWGWVVSAMKGFMPRTQYPAFYRILNSAGTGHPRLGKGAAFPDRNITVTLKEATGFLEGEPRTALAEAHFSFSRGKPQRRHSLRFPRYFLACPRGLRRRIRVLVRRPEAPLLPLTVPVAVTQRDLSLSPQSPAERSQPGPGGNLANVT